MPGIALYQPDIPQNTGAMMRLCACLDVKLHIIEPCGFPWNVQKMQRTGMDYMDDVQLERHASWQVFTQKIKPVRIVLMTTKSKTAYLDFDFRDSDILLAGRESAGVPEEIAADADASVGIPMKNGLRSLNIVNATSMILGEALRQTHGFG